MFALLGQNALCSPSPSKWKKIKR